MSRGHGRTQRMVLALLEENESAGLHQASEGMTVSELAEKVYSASLPCRPQSELSAVRRALATLARDGHVVRLGRLRDHQCRWRRSFRHSSTLTTTDIIQR
jgi:hypothetical protein